MTADIVPLTISEIVDQRLAFLVGDASALEEFVETMPIDMVPVALAYLLDMATNAATIRKGLETRLLLAGKTGEHFQVGATEYGFYGSQQKGWRDLPNLFANLRMLGLSEADIAAATSEVRVTGLREAAGRLTNEEKRQEAIGLIEENRYAKGDRGAPRFQVVDDKYITAKVKEEKR